MVRTRDPFRKLGAHRALPPIGIVGEIFCRLNTFSYENLVQMYMELARSYRRERRQSACIREFDANESDFDAPDPGG